MTQTTQQKVGAYGNQQKSGGDNRETDARALLTCASKLMQAIDDGGKDMNSYAEAIRLNQRLWTIFQVSLCDPENKLPQGLKVILLNLSRYVDRVSFRAISDFKPQLVKSLIHLNRTIATGLNRRQKQEEQGAVMTSAPAVNAQLPPPGSSTIMQSV